MELLFVVVIAAAIGGIVRYTVPGRQWHGMMLVPAVAAASAAAVWVVLLWFGFTFDGGWIWTIAIAVATIASVATSVVLPRERAAADDRFRAELGI